MPLAKRVEDVTLAVLLLLVFSPLILGVYLLLALDMLIWPDDRGSFLYRERRISRGREFDLLKFRTLRADVLRQVGGHARPYEREQANLTRAGRILKRWYLDELAQLVNVLRREMSLVGPRPWPPAMVAAQVAAGADYRRRVLAGWTGPAQVSKGQDTGRGTELDLGYVEALRTWSGIRVVRHDLGLLLETARVLFRGEGLQY